MNRPSDQPSPITSADASASQPELLPAGWRAGICWIIDCSNRIGVWIPISQIAPSVMEPLFGLPDRPHSYEEWEIYPAFAGVCGRHYTRLRTKHGTELGYAMRNGKPSAYVKDRYF